ncbi:MULTISPECIES: DUF4255 domain-containing protein [unclassified Anabaena]|uniref:DUF4255 domain-containing protein n=1 Tax=unclassified Anabaena TaxID=2619674 RepID=UPI001445FE7F|nr:MULTISPECIES: DUF4255 domain-containing protein [unclassified Anabaena]MTJ08124.1 DUF4255 domain-containing protein [Anabaena sp. UHCC 0204]MTJ53150.1 DUF4255 domain-containing protein [Anabaena sp. UHCC 0253]
MSNYLAIATVTATLQRTLQDAVQTDVYGARVTTVKPTNLGGGPSESGVNIFLYQILSNPALNNIDATPMRSKGNPSKRQAALDLYYMLSFYGNETELEPQRILGSVVRTLNDKAIVTPEMIRETLADPNYSFLRDSDLADQAQQINITPFDVNLEDLSKAWSGFFQAPYILSVVYKVLVVLIDGKDPSQRALPVRGSSWGGIAPFPNQPTIEKISSQSGTLEPILTNSTLLIKGKNLKGDITKVRIGGIEVTPPELSAGQILFPLSLVPITALKAGVQSLQIIHQTSATANIKDSFNYNNIESNVAPFVLRPTVTSVRTSNLSENNDGSYYVDVLVQVNLMIGKNQRIVLALNEWSVESPSAYLFDALKCQSDTNEITIPIDKIKPGEYLVRLIVDGAESQLDIDTNPESPTFNFYISPKLLIA